jgi:RNA polymerase sigma-70 factor (ECF subfamily)
MLLCRPFLLRVATSLTHSREDAEDLVQDTITRALTKKHLFQADTNLAAWLKTMLVNLYYDAGRRKQRRLEVSVDEAPELYGGNVEDEAIIHMELDQALADAGPILRMMVQGDLSYEEAARQLGVKAVTMNGRVYRARHEARARRREREGDGT